MSDITPGIWTVYEEGAEDGAQVWAREEGAAPSRIHVASHIGDADARLIAAAPELLEALKIIRVQFGNYTDGDGAFKFHACNIADRALAKAEGRVE